MEIITRTANGKTAFTAKVNYQGSDYLVVGQVPPAPKSSYVWFASDFVASPDVPGDVAKAIYSQLKTGTNLTDTINSFKTFSGTSAEDFTRYFDNMSYGGLAYVYNPGSLSNVLHFVLKYPGALTIDVIIDLVPVGRIRFIVKSKAQRLRKSIRPTTLSDNGLFKLESRDKQELGQRRGDSVQEVLTRIAPYIAQKQAELRARYTK